MLAACPRGSGKRGGTPVVVRSRCRGAKAASKKGVLPNRGHGGTPRLQPRPQQPLLAVPLIDKLGIYVLAGFPNQVRGPQAYQSQASDAHGHGPKKETIALQPKQKKGGRHHAAQYSSTRTAEQ